MATYQAQNIGNNCWSVIRTDSGLSTVLAVTSNTDEIPPWPKAIGENAEEERYWAERIADLLQKSEE